MSFLPRSWTAFCFFIKSYHMISLLHRGYRVTFIKVLTIYHSWVHPPRPSLLSPFPPIPRIVSTGLISHFHTWVHSISTTFTLPHPFLRSSPSHGFCFFIYKKEDQLYNNAGITLQTYGMSWAHIIRYRDILTIFQFFRNPVISRKQMQPFSWTLLCSHRNKQGC
jgi:hypothetical protein